MLEGLFGSCRAYLISCRIIRAALPAPTIRVRSYSSFSNSPAWIRCTTVLRKAIRKMQIAATLRIVSKAINSTVGGLLIRFMNKKLSPKPSTTAKPHIAISPAFRSRQTLLYAPNTNRKKKQNSMPMPITPTMRTGCTATPIVLPWVIIPYHPSSMLLSSADIAINAASASIRKIFLTFIFFIIKPFFYLNYC